MLGVNGAGKTTCFKSLTNEIKRTSGHVQIKGHDIESNFTEAAQHMGYCPKQDTLFDGMSVAEHLYFYGRLKNIKNLDSEVNRLIHDLDLEQYKGKLSQNLSGGNKRKLSTAISLIGRPSIVLLD